MVQLVSNVNVLLVSPSEDTIVEAVGVLCAQIVVATSFHYRFSNFQKLYVSVNAV